MRIDEAGNSRSAPEINNAGIRASRFADLRPGSGCRDSAVGYRRRICDWLRGVQSVDTAVEDQRISGGAWNGDARRRYQGARALRLLLR